MQELQEEQQKRLKEESIVYDFDAGLAKIVEDFSEEWDERKVRGCR
jgi:hypothetical protein